MRKGYPSFWNPKNIADPHYVPDLGRAREEARKAGVEKAGRQIKRGGARHLLIGIDYEKDFGDKGRLPVTGTYADMERFGERFIRGVLEEHDTEWIFTIDIHPPSTIHSDDWWRDEQGNPPATDLPMWMELVNDSESNPVFEGKWVDGRPSKKFRPRLMPRHTHKYSKHLTATGQGNIWVFTSHCREGTDGTSLIPALAELVEWGATARDIQPTFMYKGMIAHVDWFGPFRPCMDVDGHPQGGLQTKYLDIIGECKTTQIAGEAEDFCVNAGVLQVLEYYGKKPDILERISFLGDCTSAIVPGSDVVKNLHKMMKDKNVQVVTHDAPFAA